MLVTALVTGGKLVVANVGDCKALAIKGSGTLEFGTCLKCMYLCHASHLKSKGALATTNNDDHNQRTLGRVRVQDPAWPRVSPCAGKALPLVGWNHHHHHHHHHVTGDTTNT
eukprot:1182539-Prorocentrum_minimum.AAC.2